MMNLESWVLGGGGVSGDELGELGAGWRWCVW